MAVPLYRELKALSDAIRRAAERTCSDYRAKKFEQEPQFTERLICRIEEEVSRFGEGELNWSAFTLSDRGRGAKEQSFGADFVGVLEIKTPAIDVKKGFLAQAKFREGDSVRGGLPALRTQCDKMLRLSPDSFVFVYSDNEVRVVPAVSVASCADRKFSVLPYHRIEWFFKQHFECFVGDPRLHVPPGDTLKDQLQKLAQQYDVGNVLLIQGVSRQFKPDCDE